LPGVIPAHGPGGTWEKKGRAPHSDKRTGEEVRTSSSTGGLGRHAGALRKPLPLETEEGPHREGRGVSSRAFEETNLPGPIYERGG